MAENRFLGPSQRNLEVFFSRSDIRSWYGGIYLGPKHANKDELKI